MDSAGGPEMLWNTCLHTLPRGLAVGLNMKANAAEMLLGSMPSRKNSYETELSAQDSTKKKKNAHWMCRS